MLTQKIAEEIIIRTMKIIPYNINIMDEEGTIIATGEKARLHKLHEGAVFALEKNGRIDISEDTASLYRGAKPGVNLPIFYRKQIIGVIGITGPPVEVGAFGEIVKMAAELIVEQNQLAAQLHINNRMRDETIIQFLNARKEDREKWISRGIRFGIDLVLPRMAVFFRLQKPSVFNLSYAKGLVDHWVNGKGLVIPLSETELVVLFEIEGPFSENQRIALLDRTAAFLKRCNRNNRFITAGLGDYAEGIVQDSFRLARISLYCGESLYPDQDLYDYRRLALPVLSSTFGDQALVHEYRRIKSALLNSEQHAVLLETIQAYIELDGEISKISESLFIHRNTLRYRLQKIEEVTGYNPKTINGITALSLALMLNN
ncbi:sugar diacid recognition domain-containing protein [Metabacillus sp. FJAT-52054]|uniref:Sugar diacid recognition domain-containing protein n=1 Tax=Metabacillus sediminis TaxID=3117746 RepID=A0ABZ2NND3_9BACI